MITLLTTSCIYTPVCSIMRWPAKAFGARPGTYAVIADVEVLRFIRMNKNIAEVFMHPIAVVDDFGDLVGVPA